MIKSDYKFFTRYSGNTLILNKDNTVIDFRQNRYIYAKKRNVDYPCKTTESGLRIEYYYSADPRNPLTKGNVDSDRQHPIIRIYYD